MSTPSLCSHLRSHIFVGMRNYGTRIWETLACCDELSNASIVKQAPQKAGLFEPGRHGFVPLPDHRPPGGVRFYEYQNDRHVDGRHDFRRLNLYLSKDGDFVTIWFGLLERVLVDSLFHDHGLEPVDYDEPLFRGHIKSDEQARHILKALRPEGRSPQVITVDPNKGIVCELLKRDEPPFRKRRTR